MYGVGGGQRYMSQAPQPNKFWGGMETASSALGLIPGIGGALAAIFGKGLFGGLAKSQGKPAQYKTQYQPTAATFAASQQNQQDFLDQWLPPIA